MYLNDTYGDCTVAGACGLVGVDSANESTEVIFTNDEVSNIYFGLTGGGDDGLDLDTILQYWQDTGLTAPDGAHKISAYVAVDPTNQTELKQAIDLFGPLYCGINLPRAWHDNTTLWGPTNSGIAGGHCVLLVDYDVNYFYTRTWGMLVPTVYAGGVNTYFDEIYALISLDWDSTGVSPSGLNAAQLLADLHELGSVPDPTPQPTPPSPCHRMLRALLAAARELQK
jgi:hypothetical protein